jgi:hypothetical protein
MQTAATGQSKNKSSLPPVMKDKVDIRSWALLLSLTVIWGTSYILMKKALLVYTPIEMASLRLTVAGLVCIPFLPRAVKHIPFNQLCRRYYKFIVAFIHSTHGSSFLEYPCAAHQGTRHIYWFYRSFGTRLWQTRTRDKRRRRICHTACDSDLLLWD